MAFVSSRAQDAAQDLGVEIVGEIEFASGQAELKVQDSQEVLRSLSFLCTQHDDVSPLGVAVIAWSDLEYPSARRRRHSVAQMALAERRAAQIERALQRQSLNPIHFTRV